MNIRNCRNCGKLFTYTVGPFICPECVKSQEAKFTEVNDYIREHPGVSISTVAEECDIDPAVIRRWLREDRIQLAEDSQITLSCESCGASIRSGRFCEKCKAATSNGFNNILNSNRPKIEPAVKKDTIKDAFYSRR